MLNQHLAITMLFLLVFAIIVFHFILPVELGKHYLVSAAEEKIKEDFWFVLRLK